jgi:hypothetical protein
MGICYRWALEFVGSLILLPKALKFWYLISEIQTVMKSSIGLRTFDTFARFQQLDSDETGQNLT